MLDAGCLMLDTGYKINDTDGHLVFGGGLSEYLFWKLI